MIPSRVRRCAICLIPVVVLAACPPRAQAQRRRDVSGGIYEITNHRLTLRFVEKDGTIKIRDLRSGVEWSEASSSASFRPAQRPIVRARSITLKLAHKDTGFTFFARYAFDGQNPELPEVVVTILPAGGSPDAEMAKNLYYPPPILTDMGERLVLPINEGMLFPVDDVGVQPPQFLRFFKGLDLSMRWMGLVKSPRGAGILTLMETPDDAAAIIERGHPRTKGAPGLLVAAPVWMPSLQSFRYARTLRYVLIDRGGYVAQAQWFREYAKANHLWVSLANKATRNGNVKKLLGAANVWAYVRDPVHVAREMSQLGMDRVLWSNTVHPSDVVRINELGYLTSIYDNYQDVYPPSGIEGIPQENPQAVIWQADSTPAAGWTIKPKRGPAVTAHMDCPAHALSRAEVILPGRLRTHPYTALFLDSTTATAWPECYNTAHQAMKLHAHPRLSRSEAKALRVRLIQYAGETLKLVIGSEDGIDAAAPVLDYVEGMVTYGPTAIIGDHADAKSEPVPDSEVSADYHRFSLPYFQGHAYRIPLWELVYHDSVVVFPHWTDYASRFSSSIWQQKDLLYILYGTQPMYLFKDEAWAQQKEAIATSYRNVTSVARIVAGHAMVDHMFLNKEGSVQRTRWDNGGDVIVNFGDTPFNNGTVLVEPKSFQCIRMPGFVAPAAAKP